jgi:hypothetical protein
MKATTTCNIAAPTYENNRAPEGTSRKIIYLDVMAVTFENWTTSHRA